MKRILIVVGGVTVTVLAVAVLGFTLVASEGRRLDASSREYATQLLDATLRNWDLSAAIKGESSEELAAAVPDHRLAQWLGTFSERLGPIRSHGVPHGESRLSVVPFRKVVTADYFTPVTFEKADGNIALRLILKDGRWRLLVLNVTSDALLR